MIPPAIALVLAAPLLGFPYILDDFEFFARVDRLEMGELLPDRATLFYRPLSRELYFGALHLLAASKPLWGHVGNAALLLLATFLLASLVARIAGERAGLFTGILFSSLGALPVLVGWTSGAQDLLAIVLVLAALHFQLRGSRAGALAAAALALLSKETAVAFVPAIVLLPWLAGKGRARLRRDAAAFGILVALWAVIHPGVGHVITHRLESGGEPGGYVSLSGAYSGRSLLNTAATLVNLPVWGAAMRWPVSLVPFLAGAALLACLGVWKSGTGRRVPAGQGTFGTRAIAALALLLSVPPMLVSAALLRDWMPYYACVASLGTSLAAGVWIARLGRWPAIGLMVLALALGVRVRGQGLGSAVLTESALASTAGELRRLEHGFRTLLPRLREPKPVICAVQAPAGGSSYVHLFRFQVLRFWFENTGIDTIHPEWRRPHPPEEHLLFVGEDQTVYEVDTRTFRIRASRTDAPPFPVQSLLRSYAQGLALSGDIDRAVAILVALPEDVPHVANMNRRLAAAYLLALGSEGDAQKLLASLPPFHPRDAAEVAAAAVANPSRIDLDRAVMTAMGLRPEDPAALRFIMRWLQQNGSGSSGARVARKLLRVAPGDAEARAVIEAEEGIRVDQVLAPATPDSLW